MRAEKLIFMDEKDLVYFTFLSVGGFRTVQGQHKDSLKASLIGTQDYSY